MATNNEITAFEEFRFKIGDIVLRVTDNGDNDKGIIVGRSLIEFTAGTNRSYAVAFDSARCNQHFEEIELTLWQRSVRM